MPTSRRLPPHRPNPRTATVRQPHPAQHYPVIAIRLRHNVHSGHPTEMLGDETVPFRKRQDDRHKRQDDKQQQTAEQTCQVYRYVVEQSPPFRFPVFRTTATQIRRITRQTGYTSVNATNVPANQYICVSVGVLSIKSPTLQSRPTIIITNPSTPVTINVRRERKLNEDTISVPAFLLNHLLLHRTSKTKDMRKQSRTDPIFEKAKPIIRL